MLCTAAYACPFFRLLDTRSFPVVLLALVIAIPVCKDMAFGPQAALLAEQFDARVRFSGVSVGREFGGALFGGTAPFISTALVAAAGGSATPVVPYVVAACALTAAAVPSGRETARGEITGGI
ncbi:hypothetical protein GCM10018781_38240 [Kitasatospora indigofera]|uniref:Major facilitator superfamily (MFS) profile domain-containing protein n=1 Tax=Kitasatospora indigofera TaxID=67307 RepID=A0A919FXF4_9ACTN|nr:hypothetical protein [Kitasatospora indigofera]GHH73561.1 hypothetical protein GCM10018781_38240 [Kitasatospora indigofera]